MTPLEWLLLFLVGSALLVCMAPGAGALIWFAWTYRHRKPFK